MVELPGRGLTYVIDVPGPTPDAPTSCCCTRSAARPSSPGTPCSASCSRTYRVVAFDQRWHGRGIRSRRFRFADCADDVAALVDVLGARAGDRRRLLDGRRRSPSWSGASTRTGSAGLVLCSTARNFRGTSRERLFFPVHDARDDPLLAGYALAQGRALAAALPEVPSIGPRPTRTAGARAEFRSTSAWSMPEVLGELGRFNSAAWIGEVDVPTAVVVTGTRPRHPDPAPAQAGRRDRGRRRYDAPGGHASIVLDHGSWLPVFLEAVADVTGRVTGPRQVAV